MNLMNYVINVFLKLNTLRFAHFTLFLLISKLHDLGPKHDEIWTNSTSIKMQNFFTIAMNILEPV